jgi:NhaP-type Na+/H+ and K+/H+ antiporter
LEKLREEMSFDPNQSTQSVIYLCIIDTLCCFAQENYSNHLPNLISNDQLYGSDPKFINEINELATSVLNDLLAMLQAMSTDRPRLQSVIALELFERVATKADLTDDNLCKLAINLWNLSVKNRQDSKMHTKIYQHVQFVRRTVRTSDNYCQRLDELLNRIKNKL